MSAEPTSEAAVAAWISAVSREHDPYREVYDASEAHRLTHGPQCDVYPSSAGPMLGTLVAACRARRILEVGCGLGYSALHLAGGSAPTGRVDTLEADPTHASIARRSFEAFGVSGRVTVHDAKALHWLRGATGTYDFIFADGDPAEYPDDLPHFVRLLRPGGALLTSNLFLGVYVADAPFLAAAAEYRDEIVRHPELTTAFLPRGMALSVKRDRGG